MALARVMQRVGAMRCALVLTLPLVAACMTDPNGDSCPWVPGSDGFCSTSDPGPSGPSIHRYQRPFVAGRDGDGCVLVTSYDERDYEISNKQLIAMRIPRQGEVSETRMTLGGAAVAAGWDGRRCVAAVGDGADLALIVDGAAWHMAGGIRPAVVFDGAGFVVARRDRQPVVQRPGGPAQPLGEPDDARYDWPGLALASRGGGSLVAWVHPVDALSTEVRIATLDADGVVTVPAGEVVTTAAAQVTSVGVTMAARPGGDYLLGVRVNGDQTLYRLEATGKIVQTAPGPGAGQLVDVPDGWLALIDDGRVPAVVPIAQDLTLGPPRALPGGYAHSIAGGDIALIAYRTDTGVVLERLGRAGEPVDGAPIPLATDYDLGCQAGGETRGTIALVLAAWLTRRRRGGHSVT